MGIFSSDCENLEIRLDQEGKPFLAGDQVSGIVEVTTKKEKVKVNSVTLVVTGKTSVAFSYQTTVRTSKGNKRVTRTASTELYNFTKSFTLEHKTELLAGTKSYRFNLELPTNLRSTFHGLHGSGSTIYQLKAAVDIPMGLDKDKTKEIHVNHIRNLNKEDSTLEKVEKQEMKTFGICCFETPPITMSFVLNKKGYVDNNSGKVVNLQASFVQNTIYHGTGKGRVKKTHREEDVIGPLVIVGEVEGNAKKDFTTELLVPEVAASHCDKRAIQIYYSVKLEAIPDAVAASRLTAEALVIVGNIPHKAAYRTWAAENMHEMPGKIKEAYPGIPKYTGTNYIFFETTKVRDDPGVQLEDAKEDPEFDDGNDSEEVSSGEESKDVTDDDGDDDE